MYPVAPAFYFFKNCRISHLHPHPHLNPNPVLQMVEKIYPKTWYFLMCFRQLNFALVEIFVSFYFLSNKNAFISLFYQYFQSNHGFSKRHKIHVWIMNFKTTTSWYSGLKSLRGNRWCGWRRLTVGETEGAGWCHAKDAGMETMCGCCVCVRERERERERERGVWLGADGGELSTVGGVNSVTILNSSTWLPIFLGIVDKNFW